MKLAVLGHPIAHSRSPAMHAAALSDAGLGGSEYIALDVTAERFESCVRGLAASGYRGANVTIPHKEAALRLADTATDTARAIGAANTLTFEGSGIEADNTDAPGLLAAIGVAVADRRGLVLGAGGAAMAAVWALTGAGCDVAVWNRTQARAEELCAKLGGRPVAGSEVRSGDYDLVVNASSAGLDGSDPFDDLPLEPRSFYHGQLVVDMVYSGVPSRLLYAADRAGAETVDGLEVLVRQGAISFERWTGHSASLAAMRKGALHG